MNLFTKEQIETESFQDLLTHVLETYENREDFKLENNQVDELLYESDIFDVAALDEYYNFDFENAVFKFPYGDQRESKDYKGKSFYGRRMLPATDFFWVIKSEKVERIFGLVEVLFTVTKVQLNKNNEEHEGPNVVFKEKKHFYYDYVDGKYVQVTMEAKKGKSLKNKEEFLRRQELIVLANRRLRRENDLVYIPRLEEISQNLTKSVENKTDSIVEYLYQFIDSTGFLLDYFPLKLHFSHTDLDNYHRLKKYIENQSESALEVIKKIAEFELKNGVSDFRDKKVQEISGALDLQREAFEQIRKIQSLFLIRDKEKMIAKGKNVNLALDGYYAFNKNRLFPNLVQIEAVRFFKSSHESKDSREKEEKELLAALVKPKSSDNQKEVQDKMEQEEKEFSILSEEEKEHLISLHGAERDTFVTDLINQKIRDKVINSNEKHLYLRALK